MSIRTVVKYWSNAWIKRIPCWLRKARLIRKEKKQIRRAKTWWARKFLLMCAPYASSMATRNDRISDIWWSTPRQKRVKKNTTAHQGANGIEDNNSEKATKANPGSLMTTRDTSIWRLWDKWPSVENKISPTKITVAMLTKAMTKASLIM